MKSSPPSKITLHFDSGSLLIEGDRASIEALGLPETLFDPRVEKFRCPAYRYRDVVLRLTKSQTPFQDEARQYQELPLTQNVEREPFPHQQEAVESWVQAGRMGTVVLPTGSGKTFCAQLAMMNVNRSTLVVTPTLDLMRQWYSVLTTGFDQEVGLIGGGHYDVREITVTTYDSAYLHMERLGNRFGLLIFDECHHLPGPSYLLAAFSSLAPYRLGLTATLERVDGRESELLKAIGQTVYRKDIRELSGDFLSDYETIRLGVPLSPQERDEYDRERDIYRQFVRDHGIAMGSPSGWSIFLMLSSRSEEGRRAFLAHRRQKEIAQASEGKLRMLSRLLVQHRNDRALIFTNDNATVYRISKQFLIPAITHQTKVKERHDFLQRFREGTFPFLVTSRVLNEGVDVPEASVGIVLSGTASIREHVQRLGRILRKSKNKRAILYEVVARETAEESVSHRRRQHNAYR